MKMVLTCGPIPEKVSFVCKIHNFRIFLELPIHL